MSALQPTPTPAQLDAHYSRYYLTQGYSAERLKAVSDRHRPVLDYLTARAPRSGPLQILDYGFGAGAFLLHAAARGHQAVGADVSVGNLDQLHRFAAEQSVNIDIVQVSPESFSALDGRSFDVITLFQVIEHVPSPRALLQQLARYQQPGGLLYVECPNDAAALCVLKRTLPPMYSVPTWGSLKYPEHLHGFTRRAISILYERLGYEMVECGDYAYCDGFHQVESEFWWPRLRDNTNWSLFGLSRSAVPVFDGMMSRGFGAGSGLFALGRKKPGASPT